MLWTSFAKLLLWAQLRVLPPSLCFSSDKGMVFSSVHSVSVRVLICGRGLTSLDTSARIHIYGA